MVLMDGVDQAVRGSAGHARRRPPRVQITTSDAERDNSLVGFFNNPKRFNVAVTRAQALLVVLGHPAMLQQDRCWRALVRALCSPTHAPAATSAAGLLAACAPPCSATCRAAAC